MKRILTLMALGLPLAYAQVVPALPPESQTQAAPAATPQHLTAALQLPRTVQAGEFSVGLTLNNAGTNTVTLTASRDSDQNCAFAPLLRVLKVGSREVVYPTCGSPRICTQDALNTPLAAAKSTLLERKLTLPAGEYMVEGWFGGGVDGQSAKVGAVPVRLSVQ